MKATTTKTARIKEPTTTVGLRRIQSNAFPPAGAEAIVGTVIAALMRVKTSVADARVEEHVADIDHQVHEDLHAGEDDDEALDDGVVALQDRVDREAPEARDVERGFGDDDAGDQQREPDA